MLPIVQEFKTMPVVRPQLCWGESYYARKKRFIFHHYQTIVMFFKTIAYIWNKDTSVNRNDELWHAVTFKRNASSISLRVDGEWQNSTAVPSSIPSNNAAILSIGAKGDPTNTSHGQNFFHGDMDEIRIYDGELSDENIKILEEAQTTIAMVGDPRPGKYSIVDNELNHDLDQILKRSPSGYVDAAIMLGDADYIRHSKTHPSFMYFKTLSTARNIPWFFTMGNHELGNVYDYDEIKNQYEKNLTPGITLINGWDQKHNVLI